MMNILVESALRSLALALAVGLGLRLARARSARLQMTAWTLVLAGALLMPFLMRWRTIEMHPPQRVASTVPAFIRTVSAPGVTIPAPPVPKPIDWCTIGLGVYGAVAAILLARLLIGLALTSLLWLRARGIHELWAEASDVRESDDIRAPATFGWSILLPAEWRAWDPLQLRAVIAHESAHVEWGDFFAQLAGKVHTALFWFNPLAWWLENRMIHLAEAASDDAALQTVTDRSSYAAMLLALAGNPEHPSAAIAMARPATVGKRVERILSNATLPSNPGWKSYAQAAAMVIVVVAVAAGSSIRAQQEPAAPPASAKSVATPETAHLPESIEVHVEPATPRKTGDAWAIVSGGKVTVGVFQKDGTNAEQRAYSFRDRISGDYLWFRRGGKEYLITDPETVKRAEEMFRQQEEQGNTAYRVAIMARLAEQQALLAKSDDEAGEHVPHLAAELQAALAAEEQLRAEKAADLAANDQFRRLEDELRLAKEKDLSQDTLHRLQEQVSQAQAKLSGDLAGRIAELQAKIGELQARLAELQSRISEKQALLDQKLHWDKQLRDLTSRLESQGVRSTSDVDRQLQQLLDDCLRNGVAQDAH